jgi:hypothetical protein
VEHGTAGNVSNRIDILVREYTGLVVVSPVTSLLQESGGKTVSIGLVVGQFRVNVVVDLSRERSKVVHDQEHTILHSTKKKQRNHW